MANRTDPLAKAVHGTNPQVRTGGALVQATTVTRLFVFSFHVLLKILPGVSGCVSDVFLAPAESHWPSVFRIVAAFL